MEITLTLPWPPSVNHYKKIGRIVKTKTGKLYQQRVNSNETASFYYQVYMLCKKQIPIGWPKSVDSATISYELRVTLRPPDNKRYDIDNRLKVLLDGLVHAHVIHDDSQITRLYVEKCDIIAQGQTIVTILELNT
jgi:crossover junction endodeoxyribonuclease RusA